ncbi:hypothetical protein QOZ84_16255 [Romboutsia sedimentorum]|uniref:Helix-turn-helix type 11 domain-containing protein n=1 Tax=Romboutsia sedimentorum TaxID=1368474 RepID=A0ABT7EDS4_9FIRM|nr:hypothetical protein [Romboutsia sedimentorum]MDK2565084.1 hypothetical protein [Romboutsia sedimentorum]MDK2587514.1 hypothetical protein [Romboutsia sedimentorum]
MDKNKFNKLEAMDQVEFINKELKNKSLTKISEELKISRKTIRNRFEKIGYIYDKQSNKYRLETNKEDEEDFNNTINTKLLLERMNSLERQIKTLEEEVKSIKERPKIKEYKEIDIKILDGETVSRCYRLNKEIQKEFSSFCKQNSSYKVQDILAAALIEYMDKCK